MKTIMSKVNRDPDRRDAPSSSFQTKPQVTGYFFRQQTRYVCLSHCKSVTRVSHSQTDAQQSRPVNQGAFLLWDEKNLQWSVMFLLCGFFHSKKRSPEEWITFFMQEWEGSLISSSPCSIMWVQKTRICFKKQWWNGNVDAELGIGRGNHLLFFWSLDPISGKFVRGSITIGSQNKGDWMTDFSQTLSEQRSVRTSFRRSQTSVQESSRTSDVYLRVSVAGWGRRSGGLQLSIH